MPLATTWMELESTMQSEIRQTKTNALCHHLYVESKKNKRKYTTKEKQAYRFREQTIGYLRGEGTQEGQYRGVRLRDTNYYV